MRIRIPVTFVLAAAALLAAGCASTQLVTQWRAPDYRGEPLRRLLVVGMTQQSVERRAFEDTMVSSLRAGGVDAVAAYSVLPEDGEPDQARLARAASEAGADGLLATRVVKVDKEARVDPAYPYGYPGVGFGIYGGSRGVARGGWFGYGGWYPPVVLVYDTVVLETRLVDAKTQTLAWGVTTRTPDPTYPRRETEALAKLVLENLTAAKLVAPSAASASR